MFSVNKFLAVLAESENFTSGSILCHFSSIVFARQVFLSTFSADIDSNNPARVSFRFVSERLTGKDQRHFVCYDLPVGIVLNGLPLGFYADR